MVSSCKSSNVATRVCAHWRRCKARSRYRRSIRSVQRTNTRAGCRDSCRASAWVVWAKDDDGRVGGFIVEKDAPGFRARDIEGKFSLRMSRTSECWFENCRIPAQNRLPKASGLGAPLSCLSHARAGIAWGVIGAAIDCYETALAYAKSREQFGRPIAGFQLVQQKLVWMVQEITKAQLLALRLTRMMEEGTALPAQISLAKRNNV